MTSDANTPSKAAYRLTKLLNVVAQAHGIPRFPIDVPGLSKETAHIFGWSDPITEVRAANIPGFEGALYGDVEHSRWLLLYNETLRSPGRIRFTQAHELGHYILHRLRRANFECTEADMRDWSEDDSNIEGQADAFAATLLMPLDDFRNQVGGAADFDMLGAAADRYGVSLTAVALRWLQHTDIPAIMVVHRDGFMDWSWSSSAAMRAGAFFKTKASPIAIPAGSLADDAGSQHHRTGKELDSRVWFPRAESGMPVREMKITSDNFDYCMTLLVLPRGATVWPPWEER